MTEDEAHNREAKRRHAEVQQRLFQLAIDRFIADYRSSYGLPITKPNNKKEKQDD